MRYCGHVRPILSVFLSFCVWIEPNRHDGEENAHRYNNNQPGHGNKDRNWPKVRVCNGCIVHMQYLQFESYWSSGPKQFVVVL